MMSKVDRTVRVKVFIMAVEPYHNEDIYDDFKLNSSSLAIV